jgi:hypothetical protein
MFKYKMVQIPPNISIQMKTHRGNEAAEYLEGVVNTYADQGWEFYRIDSVGVHQEPGCFGALTGDRARTDIYYVITFRMRA